MPFVERPPARHDLIWLDSDRWRDALLAPLPDEWMGALGEWFKRGRPAVVRRQESSTANAISLGVALPPSRGKTKIPLLVERRVVTRASAPLLLATALVSAPPAWQAALQSLVDAARERGIEFRVYGSLAWQHLSGEPYLTATSDVDLLWTARNGALLEISIVSSSGKQNLDRGLIAAFQQVAPFPPLPAEIPGDSATFTLSFGPRYQRR